MARFRSRIPSISRFGDRSNLASLLDDIGLAMLEEKKFAEAARILQLAIALCPYEECYHHRLAEALEPIDRVFFEVARRRYHELKRERERCHPE